MCCDGDIMKNVLYAIVLASALTFPFAGCGGGGSKTTAVQETRTTTTGQELIDLQKAYEAGIISQKQYDQQKQKILNQK